jgi:hypothetical protein
MAAAKEFWSVAKITQVRAAHGTAPAEQRVRKR